MRIFLTFIALLISIPAFADNAPLNTKQINAFPVLHEGRLQPLQSFANIQKEHIAGQADNAMPWLLQTLFDPANAIKSKSFYIRNTALKGQFELNDVQSVFSFEELQNGLQKTQKRVPTLIEKTAQGENLSPEEQALLNIHDRALGYADLLQSFSAFLPMNTPQGPQTYLQLKTAGKDINTIEQSGSNSRLLKIIPSPWEKGLWLSPWEAILSGQGSPETKALLEDWQSLALAYQNKDNDSWTKALEDIQNKTSAIHPVNTTRLTLENTYKNTKPYLWIIALYALGIAFIKRPKTALAMTIAAILAHACAVAVRIYILDRPPVGTLYESVLFVSLICVALGLITAKKAEQPLALIAGNISALFLLTLSPFLIQGQDSLEVLVAVLNTNFWLATHVLCITIGYGVCILAAALAHAALIAKALGKAASLWMALQKYVYVLSLIALLFTSVGTILGGIWADQSWGRFWGWDPKENGALLIVLWLIWAQHGRLSARLSPNGFLAGIAALNIIVALAWFGVNLLSVGLHSYGFTSGLASGLLAFCIAELMLIAALTYKVRTLKT